MEQISPGKGGELQLTDALLKQAEAEMCYALDFTGKHYDTGNPIGFLKASIAYALKHPDISTELREYIRQSLDTIPFPV